MAETFAGYSVDDMSAFLGISPAQASAMMALANQHQLDPAQQKAYGTIPQSAFPNIEAGFQHDVEHPKGSHYRGDSFFGANPFDLIGNFATGGLYGLGKAGFDVASGKQDVLGGLRSGGNQLGPWGSTTYPFSPQLAETGNLIGAGAGIGGGLASGETGIGAPGGFGTAAADGATTAPYYTGYGINADALTAGMSGGGSAAGTGSGALLGASAGQSLASMLGGASPLSMPGGGAPSAGPTGPGNLTPQQIAALSAMNDEAHKGLAPTFEQRMAGKSPGPGIAGLYFTSGGS